MDNVKHTQPNSEQLTRDDMDMLTSVLKRVHGSTPNDPYRQADFFEELEPEA